MQNIFNNFYEMNIDVDDIRPMVRLRMNELAQDAVKKFRNSILPIYGATASGTPVHIGSCLLLLVNGCKIILTAAHVIDENKNTTLYLGADSNLEEITEVFHVTKTKSNKRDDDKFDFAFSFISDDLSKKISFNFIEEKDLLIEESMLNGCLFTVLGYPNSKNKKYDNKNKVVAPTLLPYSNVKSKVDIANFKIPNNGIYHIILDYNKFSKDEDGNIVNSINMKGMSGGAVVYAGQPAKLSAFLGNECVEPSLAGIFIELQEKKLLVCVKISLIIQSIKQYMHEKEI